MSNREGERGERREGREEGEKRRERRDESGFHVPMSAFNGHFNTV